MFRLRKSTSLKNNLAKEVIADKLGEEYTYVVDIIETFELAENKEISTKFIKQSLEGYEINEIYYSTKKEIISNIPETYHKEIKEIADNMYVAYFLKKSHTLTGDYEQRSLYKSEDLFTITCLISAHIARIVNNRGGNDHRNGPGDNHNWKPFDTVKNLLGSLFPKPKPIANINYALSEILKK